MTPEDAAQRQQDVIDAPANLYVRACPGAGKTRTVVGRFMRLAEENAPRAVAVISFTNRAADEVSRRCAETGRPRLPTYPNFVGTFDRFIATYVVRPFGQLGGPIRIIDSWEALDVQIGAFGVQGTVSLDHFEVSPDGVLRFDRRPRDPAANGQALARLEKNALQRYKELRDQGYLTCDDARAYAVELLTDHPEILHLLRERFAEIIVDEAQDCSLQELALLTRLRDAGIPIAVVCDPHQSIYEWRDADPQAFEAFVDGMPTIELDGNWRSAPSICALAATLRGGPPDVAVGPLADEHHPVIVIRYTGWPSSAIGERFVSLAAGAGIDPAEAVVLGHRANSAANAVGAGVPDGQNNVMRLATACVRLADNRIDPRKRQREFNRLQRILLRALRVDAVGQSTERAAELAGVSLEWLRRSAIQLATAVGSHDLDLPVADWLVAARGSVGSIAASEGRTCAAPGTMFPTPQNSAGKTMRELLKAQAGQVVVRHSSVHKAKGTEDRAVLVVLPRDRAPSTHAADVIAAWEVGATSEAKRVLYVGVTRAEQLCSIAVPEALADRVIKILADNDVPFVVEAI
jgi:DNA helicase II / ATP-dependent DNA helicase PcrA